MSCDVGEATENLENEQSSHTHTQQNSFSNLSVKLPTSQLILQPFSRSLSNPSVALPTSKLILQPFRCFTYVTAHSPTLLLLLLHHRIFTYITWRAAHALEIDKCAGPPQTVRTLVVEEDVLHYIENSPGTSWGPLSLL